MALKDWRQDGRNEWFHKKENKHISITKIKYGKYARQYSVFWTSNVSLNKSHTGNVFKTKIEALKLVKYLKVTN